MYVDPGFGLFIVQAIVSAALGVLFVGRSFIRRAMSRMFDRGKSPEQESPSETNIAQVSSSADAADPESIAERKSRVG